MIVADDLGYADVGFHGGRQIPTPNLDALAKSGTRFTNGYVSCPVCSPTRAGLTTGRYQQRFGHEFNPGPGVDASHEDFGLPLTESTSAQALKSAGYATGIVGKWHLGFAPKFNPLERGFDEFYGFLGGAHAYVPGEGERPAQAAPILRGRDAVEKPDYLTDAFGREAVAFIQRHREQPFLLHLTFNAVHAPLQAPPKYLERFKDIEDEKRRTYAAMLSALDDNVGLVLGTLRDAKLEEDTLIFFISDNGGPPKGNSSKNDPLNGAKGTVWEGGIRVPFLPAWKGHVPAGGVYDQPVIALDIPVTAAAVAGASLGSGKPVDGVNLIPYVTGEVKDAPHQQLTWRFGPQWAIRQGQYKLLKIANQPPKLFDLAADIGEKNDLASAKPEVAAQLQKAFDAWNSQLEEPRWRPAAQRAQNQRRAANRTAS